MRAPAPGVAATHLPWLSPSAASLVALVRLPPAASWSEVRCDPGAVLLLGTREPSNQACSPSPSDCTSVFHGSGPLSLFERIMGRLDGSDAGFVDWDQPAVRPVYQAALCCARLAHLLAERSGRCDPDQAWAAGLLAPLGWLAVCAVDAEQAADCLADPDLAADPRKVQQRRWGLEQAGIARRLARRWRLPHWLATITGRLDLPSETAQRLGADPHLFRVTQMAVGLAQRHGANLHLAIAAPPEECASALNLTLEAVEREIDSLRNLPSPIATWTSPESMPLLRDCLVLAAENQRLVQAPALERLEQDTDQLHQALQELSTCEEDRLQERKLTALAEFAAGAGHEINNPLAVISGQAQYLLLHEPDPGRQRALQTIIGQAQRIHHLLSDLMQFARPPRPQKQWVDVPGLVREVALSLNELAVQRRVQIVCPPSEDALRLHGDPRQLHAALACLLRNAIEATPAEGWAGVRLQTPSPDRVEFVVEDNGQGPDPAQCEHLFDPFFSGRPAGRGRGLGLPTAWRLAREHGGDVRFEGLSSGLTRFVLSLPLEPGTNGAARNGHVEVLAS